MDLSKFANLPATPGLYKITLVPTGEFYVGSSWNIRSRIKTHFYQLSNKLNVNPLLTKAFAEHAEDHFIAEEVLRYDGSSRSELYEIERRYIMENLPPFNVQWNSNVKMQASRENLPLLLYDIKGVFVSRHESIRDLSAELQVSEVAIRRHLKSPVWLVRDHQIREQLSEMIPLTIEPFDISIPVGPNQSGDWRVFWNRADYTIYQWDLTGDLLSTWGSKEEVVKYLGCYHRSLDDHLHGQRGSLMGYVFTITPEFPGYINNKGVYNAKPVRMTPIGWTNEEEVEFSSYSEASRHFGVSKGAISTAYKKEGKWKGYLIKETRPNKRDISITMTPDHSSPVLIFDSFSSASRHFNAGSDDIARMCRPPYGTGTSGNWRAYKVEVINLEDSEDSTP